MAGYFHKRMSVSDYLAVCSLEAVPVAPGTLGGASARKYPSYLLLGVVQKNFGPGRWNRGFDVNTALAPF